MPDVSGKTAGYVGRNTKLYWSTNAGSTYQVVPETINIDPAEPSVGTVDRTHTTSPNRRRETKLGYIDDGTVSVQCNALHPTLDASGYAIHKDIFDNQGKSKPDYRWKIEAIDDDTNVIMTQVFPGDIESARFGPYEGETGVDFNFVVRRTGVTVITP